MSLMKNLSRSIELIFDTGVQIVVLPVPDDWLEEQYGVRGDELAMAFKGHWRPSHQYYSIQFKIRRRGTDNDLAVAIDTRRGSRGKGFIAEGGQRDVSIPIALQFEVEGREVSIGLFDLSIADSGTGKDTVPVALCIDLGNSRTTALAIEPPPEDNHIEMRHLKPIRLRSMTDPFLKDELIFESAFEFRPPVDLERPVQFKYDFMFNRGGLAKVKRMLGRQTLFDAEVTRVESSTFNTKSIGAIGAEAVAWREMTDHRSPIQTGVSSPKRYMWSTRPHSAQWSFASRDRGPQGIRPIFGDVLQYLHPDDSDEVLRMKRGKVIAPPSPVDPRHPARVTASLFIFELLLRVAWHLNSHEHRETTESPSAPREIRWVTVTFPSVYGPEDQERLRTQIQKGARLYQSVDCRRPDAPEVEVIVEFDEGVASQLFYLDSREKKPAGCEGEDGVAPTVDQDLASAPRGECVASVDIGGGTIDVAVVRYENGNVLGQRLCRVLLVDGARVGGDDLCKELINRIILPTIIVGAGIANADDAIGSLISTFVGDVLPDQRALRVRILRGILMPLSHMCLEACSDGKSGRELELRLGDIAEDELVEDFGDILFGQEQGVDRLRGVELVFKVAEIEDLVTRFLRPFIDPLVEELTSHKPETILLCGRLAGLSSVQRMVQERVGPGSCEVEPFGIDPGVQRRCRGLFAKVSRDPKLSVVLGAAIATASRLGYSLKGGPIRVDYTQVYQNYTWGIVDPETNRFSEVPGAILLDGLEEQAATRIMQGRYLIGRRHNSNSRGEVVVEYEIRLRKETEVEFQRSVDTSTGHERLVASAVRLDQERVNLRRTAIGDRYWLDSGELELELDAGAAG